MTDFPLPLIGFSAFSGSGKTTLLIQLLPLLKSHGLRVAVVKHAHHLFDMDHPGKDSYELRKAGADQMLVASRSRMAFIKEFPEQQEEPVLGDVLNIMPQDQIDLVLVEGFKLAAIPKIEIHRPSLGKPLLFPHDKWIVAVATDSPLDKKAGVTQLNLNNPQEIATFILKRILYQPVSASTY